MSLGHPKLAAPAGSRSRSSSAPELGVHCLLLLCTAVGRAHVELTNTIHTNGRYRLTPLVAIKVLSPSSRRAAIGFHSRTSLRAPTDRQLSGLTPKGPRVQRRRAAGEERFSERERLERCYTDTPTRKLSYLGHRSQEILALPRSSPAQGKRTRLSAPNAAQLRNGPSRPERSRAGPPPAAGQARRWEAGRERGRLRGQAAAQHAALAPRFPLRGPESGTRGAHRPPLTSVTFGAGGRPRAAAGLPRLGCHRPPGAESRGANPRATPAAAGWTSRPAPARRRRLAASRFAAGLAAVARPGAAGGGRYGRGTAGHGAPPAAAASAPSSCGRRRPRSRRSHAEHRGEAAASLSASEPAAALPLRIPRPPRTGGGAPGRASAVRSPARAAAARAPLSAASPSPARGRAQGKGRARPRPPARPRP